MFNRIAMHNKWVNKLSNDPLKMHAFNFIIIVGLLLYFYRSTLNTLIEKYSTSGTYAHGFLILPIVLWLIFQKRHYFSISAPRYEPLGFIVILALSLLWYIAGVVYVDIVQQLCLLLMLIVLFICFFGLKISLKFIFPLAYLLFAIPFGNFLTPFLQHITTFIAANILNLFGIPVYFEGLYISTAHGEFEVAEACSGIRYIIATVTLGVLYAYYTYKYMWKRIIFSGICLIFPIIANSIRVFIIILIAHASNMKYAIGIDHLIYGWIFFGIVLSLLFLLGSLFRDTCEQPFQPPASVKSADRNKSTLSFSLNQHSAIVLFFLAMLLGPLLNWYFQAQHSVHSIPFVTFPPGVGEWSGPFVYPTSWQPKFYGANSEKLFTYSKNNTDIDVYIAQYIKQTHGNELVSERNHLYNHKQWSLIQKRNFKPNLETPKKVQELQIQSKNEFRLVWYWFYIDGTPTANHFFAKFLEGKQSMTLRRKPLIIVAISTNYSYSKESARLLLQDFAKEMLVNFNLELYEG